MFFPVFCAVRGWLCSVRGPLSFQCVAVNRQPRDDDEKYGEPHVTVYSFQRQWGELATRASVLILKDTGRAGRMMA